MKIVDCNELSLKKVSFLGDVVGKFGTVEIEQVFVNKTRESLEVNYTFPIVETATVTGFEVCVGDNVIKGVCKEKSEALKDYHENIVKGNSGYMLNQDSDNIFNVSIEYFVNNNNDKKENIKPNKKILPKLVVSISVIFVLILSILLFVFIPRTPSVESSIFNIDNKNLKMECVVSNETSTFSFNDKFNVPFRNEWKLYADINAKEEIPSNVVELNEGNNTYYLLVSNSGNDKKLYAINIRRRPMYMVTFVIDNMIFQQKNIEEGECVGIPNEPTRDGYNFDKWDFDFVQPITSDTRITSIWIARTDTKYNVLYYQEKLDGSGYELICTEEFMGTTGTYITTEIKEYQHFSHLPQQSSGNAILRYNGQNFKHYYDRNRYTVTFDGNGGTNYGDKTWTTTIKYGQFPSHVPFRRNGYNFEGWDCDLYNITSDVTVKAIWSEWCTLSTTTNNESGGYYSKYNLKVGRNETTTLYARVYEGYIFEGWYIGEEFITNESEYDFKMPTGDVVLVAKFTKIS